MRKKYPTKIIVNLCMILMLLFIAAAAIMGLVQGSSHEASQIDGIICTAKNAIVYDKETTEEIGDLYPGTISSSKTDHSVNNFKAGFSAAFFTIPDNLNLGIVFLIILFHSIYFLFIYLPGQKTLVSLLVRLDH